MVGGEGKAVRDSLPPSGFLFHSERSDVVAGVRRLLLLCRPL